ELDDGLLPAGLHALDHPAALRLGLHLDDVHGDDVDLEELLDRLADLGLVRVGVDAERVLAVGRARVALLGHDRGECDLACVHRAAPPSPAALSLARVCTSGSAFSETTSERAQTTALTSRSD